MKNLTKPMLRLLTFSFFLLTTTVTSATFVSVDSRATYLRTESDTALDAVAVSLSFLGISSGDLIRIERLGFYTPLNPDFPDSIRYLDAVFSGSSTLLASANLNRVQDAIDVVTDFASAYTWLGNLPTDIPQDFAVDDGSTFSFVELLVPAGATHIFFTVNDSLFGDNADLNGDFGAAISVVPEPSTTAIACAGLLLGLFRFLLRSRTRRVTRWPAMFHLPHIKALRNAIACQSHPG